MAMNDMPTDGGPFRLPLLQFLKHSRQLHQQHVSGTLTYPVPIYVLGNTSADLDSMISAIVYSYFASGNLRSPLSSHGRRPHIPLINLPTVPSGLELRRLRPEFVKALSLSTRLNSSTIGKDRRDGGDWSESSKSVGTFLQEHILTVADLTAQQAGGGHRWSLDTVMVDWNAFPSSRAADAGRVGALDSLSMVDFNVVGCIDHHVDEGFVSQTSAGRSSSSAEPVLVELGPGSCTSLVIRELRQRGLWQGGNTAPEELHIAKLAMAPILIDTNNLTYKATDTDRDSVAFLEEKIQSELQGTSSSSSWNRESFFHSVSESKQNSLDMLTIHEILGRDYKEWVEETAPPEAANKQRVKIGVACCVKPIEWIVGKARSELISKTGSKGINHDSTASDYFLDSLRSFSADHQLNVVVVMTAFTDSDNKFRRELSLWSLQAGPGEECCKSFASHCQSELGLVDWSSTPSSQSQQQSINNKHSIAYRFRGESLRIWEQTDLSKSRKKVAPLLRGEAARFL